MNIKNIANFGSLPYGTLFIYEGNTYKKNVYPGYVTYDSGYGSALDKNDINLMFNNMQLVEIIYAIDN